MLLRHRGPQSLGDLDDESVVPLVPGVLEPNPHRLGAKNLQAPLALGVFAELAQQRPLTQLLQVALLSRVGQEGLRTGDMAGRAG